MPTVFIDGCGCCQDGVPLGVCCVVRPATLTVSVDSTCDNFDGLSAVIGRRSGAGWGCRFPVPWDGWDGKVIGRNGVPLYVRLVCCNPGGPDLPRPDDCRWYQLRYKCGGVPISDLEGCQAVPYPFTLPDCPLMDWARGLTPEQYAAAGLGSAGTYSSYPCSCEPIDMRFDQLPIGGPCCPDAPLGFGLFSFHFTA